MEDCTICNRIELAKKGDNPYLIEEFENSYFVVGDHQLYRGYSLLLLKEHVTELHQLPEKMFLGLMEELRVAGQAIEKTFMPDKMNYSCLGNSDPHVHWHLIPRYKRDGDWGELPWKKIRLEDKHLMDGMKAREMANQIRMNMEHPRMVRSPSHTSELRILSG
ncbi:MAG: HIT family protein [Halobacteriovoraceae bacterium]|jgi:diadenosine tetraphosphate (Ap4A) HIT family hydrolase|nr:HIT family protein [Halobacteriovoraceae bacterium]MBT5093710.1 HIT family protein [Halobacteriovoraceae bacterium]